VSADTKVGIVVILGVAMLILGAAFLSDYWGVWGAHEMIAYFEDSQGITPGTSVRLAGVTIGRVTAIRLEEIPDFPGRPAAVHMYIQRPERAGGVQLYKRDRFRIEAGGILGEKFINVIRTPSVPRELLPPGEPVAGETSPGVSQLVSESSQLVRTLNDVIVSVGDVAADPQMLEDIRYTVSELRGLTADVRAQLAEGRIDRILNDLARAAATLRTKLAEADIEGVIEKLDRTAEEGRQLLAAISEDDIRSAIANVRAMTENLQAASEEFRHSVVDSDLVRDAQLTMASMRRISTDIEATAKYMREQLTDAEMLKDVDEILANARELTVRGLDISEDLAEAVITGKEAVASAQRIATRFEDRFQRPVRPLRKIVVDPRAELTLGASTGDLQLDADVFFGKRGSPSQIILGMRDFGGASEINLQFARRVSDDVRIRGGLIAGDVGGAVDLHFGGPWGLTTEAYERGEQWRLDFTGSYDFGSGLSGLFGFDDVLGEVDPFLGSRYEW